MLAMTPSSALTPLFRSGTSDFKRLSPRKRSPNPTMNSPKDFIFPLAMKKIGNPTPIMGTAILARLNLPIEATIQAVIVVPRWPP